MPLKSNLVLAGILLSQLSYADIPVEVIGSCKDRAAVKPSVIFTKMFSPSAIDDTPGCDHHLEITEGTMNYGAISCNNENYLIIKHTQINLNTAINRSVNPAYLPGIMISQQADWSKITFNDTEYLCIDDEVSPSGRGADVSQYYIVENAFNASTPVLYYFLFDKDVMPTVSSN